MESRVSACRTRAVWQYRPVPSLSGTLPALPLRLQAQAALSFTGLLRQPGYAGLLPASGYMALTAPSNDVEWICQCAVPAAPRLLPRSFRRSALVSNGWRIR